MKYKSGSVHKIVSTVEVALILPTTTSPLVCLTLVNYEVQIRERSQNSIYCGSSPHPPHHYQSLSLPYLS